MEEIVIENSSKSIILNGWLLIFIIDRNIKMFF